LLSSCRTIRKKEQGEQNRDTKRCRRRD